MSEDEAAANNEELSISEASLEFGVSANLIRSALRTGQLTPVPHRWGTRVQRSEMASFAQSSHPSLHPSSRSVRMPSSPAAFKSGPRSVARAAREQRIIDIIGRIGQATPSRIHQLFITGGEDIPYSTVSVTLRHLAMVGRLISEKHTGRYIYRLPQPDEEQGNSLSTPSSPPAAAPRAARQMTAPTHPPSMALSEVEQDTLTAMQSIGQATNLDEIYRAMRPSPRYIEMVQAVRRLVELRLIVRLKHEHRYLYQVMQ